MQGPDRISKLETAVREDLLKKSERTKDQMTSTGDLGQLNSSQEQTERNTRDIAKSAEEIQGGSDPAALLTKAASKMERAIVHLREKKLTDAYEPPQVEALATLDEAKKLIDEQKRKVDEQLAQQQKEAIRLVYVKIKEDQEKLNAEDHHHRQSPQGRRRRRLRTHASGSPRATPRRTGQALRSHQRARRTPRRPRFHRLCLGQQGHRWLDESGQRRSRQADHRRTHAAEQVRIVEQLDAMIKSLTTKPLDRKFEARGGGGGQCKPGMPSKPNCAFSASSNSPSIRAPRPSTHCLRKTRKSSSPSAVAQGELRDLLDKMFRKASNGQFKLGAEPDNRDQLPEEAGVEKVENQELDKELLDDNKATEKVAKDFELVGDRMARVRQRLALNTDPGKVTQTIEDRIDKNLIDLIEMARAQQAQGKPNPNQKQAQKPGQPKPGEPKPTNEQANGKGQSKPNRGNSPAGQSNAPGGANLPAVSNEDIAQKMAEWGGITKRQRDAIMEGAGETVVENTRNWSTTITRPSPPRDRAEVSLR
jgi:hypothetical protein